MTDLEFRRRVIAQWGTGGEDKFKDFALGMYANERNSDYTNNLEWAAMTPWIQIQSGHSYTFKYGWTHPGYGNSICIILKNEDGSRTNYYDATGSSRTVTLTNWSEVRMPIDFKHLTDAYILDNTTGEYIWRGSDYVE